jgi:predicted permease
MKNAMLTKHLLVALRSLAKNKLYSFLNIAGLSIGLAASIIVLLWVDFEWGFNRFHTNLPQIHVLLQNQTQGGITYTFRAMPGPLAAGLRTEFPEVEWAARGSWPDKLLLSSGDKQTYESGFHVEPDFFRIFNFPVLAGDPFAGLGEAGSVVLTQRTAQKFFGSEDPIGKVIRVDNQHDMKVVAVLADLPRNSSLRFDVLLPFSLVERNNLPDINTSWDNNSWPTWALLRPDADVRALNAKLENYIQGKNPDAAAHAWVYPLSELHLRGKFKEGKPDGGREELLKLLAVVGGFVLLIACVNFMNLATARSAGRAREVGVRKAVGAGRGRIVGQFLAEAMLMTLMALLMALALVKLALPAFNRVADKELHLGMDNLPVWGAILGLGLLTGLVAGSYPAAYLSRFKPALALKGVLGGNLRREALLRKGLVTFQFFISIFLIIITLVVHRQMAHLSNRPIGYETEALISIPMRGNMADRYQPLKRELLQVPGVRAVTASTHSQVSIGSNTSGIHWPGRRPDQDFLISITAVGYDFAKTMGMQLVDGRDFSPDFSTDTLACLLNETAVRMMELEEPVGTLIRHDTNYTVVGVLRDYVFNGLENKVEPLVVFLTPAQYNLLFVRFDNDARWKDHLAQVEACNKRLFPDFPFEYRFVQEEHQRSLEGARSTAHMSRVFALIAIFISCLGLFGLSAFFAEKRGKEIGIRKVLGASIASVWLALSKDFFQPVLLAFALTLPLGIWAVQKLLSNFDYRIEVSWHLFALAGLGALLIAACTVSFQGIKAALANPVKSLRQD